MKRDNFKQDVLGQFFTPLDIVERMVAIRKNKGSVLEPSAGDGAFMGHLESDAVGIEIDRSHCGNDSRVINADFFDYSTKNGFDTIIGNPPYVRHQDIGDTTRPLLDMELFDRRSNLYLFFIAKCVEHLHSKGELILITPRDFLKATSARKMNEMLFNAGSMTHYYEMGDAPIFEDAAPNCAIWRWQKDLERREMETGGEFNCINGQIVFGSSGSATLGDFFDIKVGAVSGADDVFTNDKYATTQMVCSRTRATKETRGMIYNEKHRCLSRHKARLMSRKIRNFTEKNWWEWGRGYCKREGERVYVNAKTRNSSPFFCSTVEAYDGSVLALFPKAGVDAGKAAENLNRVDWEKFGFVCDGRLSFTQRSLANAPVEV